MRTIELSAGTIDYEDSAGDGPVVVLVHGLLLNASLWDRMTVDLSVDHRCIAPTLPLGAHEHPMRAEADLSLPALARLLSEFLDALDLTDVTLVGNDTGGALVQLLIGEPAPRVGRVVLASCEAFDNFPPGLTGKAIMLAGKLPPRVFGMFVQQLRLRPLRRLPVSFGWLTKRGDDVVARCLRPVLTRADIRRDTVRMLRAAGRDTGILDDAARRLPAVPAPTLVVWAAEDRVMPPEHGRLLAALIPRGQLVEVEDSYTLIPLDQPTALADAIRAFIRG